MNNLTIMELCLVVKPKLIKSRDLIKNSEQYTAIIDSQRKS